MTFAEFKGTLTQKKPPAGLTPALVALWWAGKDQWDKAHQIVMDEDNKECAWVHAYLHRVEGDLGNAGYWYRQARRPVPTKPLAAEWSAIAETLLEMAGSSNSASS
jgi:hypothetical protein